MEKGHESFISKSDAELVLDKSGNSSILTPSEVKTIAAGNADILKEQNQKEPWQMTENEYNKYVDSVQDRASRGFSSTGAIGQPGREPTKDSFKAQQELHEKSLGWTHKDQIKQALSEGKPVPPEVLAEYPELSKPTEKLAPKTEEKPKLAAFVEVAQKLENEPVEMKGNKDLKDYAGMNPQAAAVMGWPDKDHAIELDEHQ